jgi:hypothetical protein
MSVDMTAMGCQQLRVALWLHSKTTDQTASRLANVHAVTNAWSVIDAGHRLRVLVRKLPGLKHGPAVVSFLQVAEQVEPLRNGAALGRCDRGVTGNGRPVRGVLSWVNADPPDAKCFSVRGLLAGTMAPTSASMVNPMGRVVEVPIGLGHVGSGGNDVCVMSSRRSGGSRGAWSVRQGDVSANP